MHKRARRVTAMLFAACLLGGVAFRANDRTTHGQQSVKRAYSILRERGVIESARAVDIRNKVPGQTRIVFIVPEGTSVKEGDVLVRLDSTAIEESIVRLQLEAAQARAKLRQAEVALESIKFDGALQVKIAESALEVARSEKELVRGEDGEWAVEQIAVESEMTIAKARLKTAQFLLDRVEADPLRAREVQLTITEASESLKVAEARKRFLDGPQRRHKAVVRDLAIAKGTAGLERRKFHLSRSVEGSTAEVAAQQAAFDYVTRKLDREKEQLRHCRIVAPQDGMAVYPNTGGRRASGFELQAGAVVRERQVLVRLPDLNQLQLKLHVNKATVDQLRVGQPATIKIDAFPDRTKTGKVKAIPVAEPPNRVVSNVKQYPVIVSLDEPPAPAKLGLTATIEFRIFDEKKE